MAHGASGCEVGSSMPHAAWRMAHGASGWGQGWERELATHDCMHRVELHSKGVRSSRVRSSQS